MRNLKLVPFLRATMVGLTIVPASLVLSSTPLHSQTVQNAETERWLEIERVYGNVTVENRTSLEEAESREAQVGDRLSQSGDTLTTAQDSTSTLAIDSAIGRVQMAQDTHLLVDQLGIQADGARITLLDITRGQVRVQARRFTNPNTRLEIRTPSGVAAVRGTDFGVSINPSGTMAIATESGAVEVNGNTDAPGAGAGADNFGDTSVMVYPGYMSTIAPGEAPSPPRLIDRRLDIEILRQSFSGSRVHLKAKVDPANSVLFEGEEVVMDKEGIITTSVALHHSVLKVVVRNPMGDTREHFFWIKDD